MKTLISFVTVFALSFPLLLNAEDTIPALAKAQSLLGRYSGKGTAYGINAQGIPFKMAEWSEELVASNARVEGDRALVDVKGVMTGDGWAYENNFVEGFFVESDKSAGLRFFVNQGMVTVEMPLGPNTWQWGMVLLVGRMSSQDLANMGILVPRNKILDLRTKTLKQLVVLNGKEVDVVVATTHIEWKAEDGTKNELDFVSAESYHVREPSI